MSTVVAVDLFAGLGGLTEGAEQAGARVAVALNHWQFAVDVHSLNHPDTVHVCQDARAKSSGETCPRSTCSWAAHLARGTLPPVSTASTKTRPSPRVCRRSTTLTAPPRGRWSTAPRCAGPRGSSQRMWCRGCGGRCSTCGVRHCIGSARTARTLRCCMSAIEVGSAITQSLHEQRFVPTSIDSDHVAIDRATLRT